jgi:periplasmic copper chaperone A
VTREPTTVPLLRHATLLVLTVAVAALGLAGCGGGEPDLHVGRAQASPPVAGSSQIVVTIENRGDGRDRLLGGETPAALAVELHQTIIEDGQAMMVELDDLEVPAGGQVRFRPGDLHLMLVVPDETVVVGGTFDLTLRFDRSGEVTVPVEVVELLDLVEDADDAPDA